MWPLPNAWLAWLLMPDFMGLCPAVFLGPTLLFVHDRIWVTAIVYVRTRAAWPYPAVVLDPCRAG